ncbi:glycerophosphodiester phosphodiesterase family protein [Sphingosinicella sp. CPCC 101087]|uniref:glycerophosphodiester phosphodiesterase family protein n=1 Tax=Sphingosinicella sp. CPCC 101087 TaxID=2497754 RepID=UPI00101D0B7C|nr:glycerophosphodiester phosphodiesterase family protein [Sphingosinicella sp. CPCC 101087]
MARRERLARLIARPFAHRGLHGKGRVENSRAAFDAAIAAGFGIELDVQASADGEAIVFHDYDLERLTESRGLVAAFTADSLARVRLRGTAEAISTLPEVLDLIGGRTPLLIELKSPGRRVAALSGAVQRALERYDGPVAVMSFNPEIGRWFARNAPGLLRGLVVTEAGRRWRGGVARQIAFWRSRPDFLAYDIRDLPSRFAARQRSRGHVVLTWTCRSEDEKKRAGRHADQVIFEEAEAAAPAESRPA